MIMKAVVLSILITSYFQPIKCEESISSSKTELESSIDSSKNRDGRLLVTTSVVTSTLQTSTSCFVFMGAAPTTACSRKKRSIIDTPIPGLVGFSVSESDHSEKTLPKKEHTESDENELSGLNRLARVLYFITSTSTQIQTSFTKTTTFTLVGCTPANLGLTMC